MPNLNEIKSQLSELAPFTKKDLETLYDLSANTVYKTLQSCGLSTTIEQYDYDQIATYFHAAREMLTRGMNHKDVAKHFGQGSKTEQPPQQEPNATGYSEAQGQEGANQSAMAAFQLINKLAHSDAKKAAKAYIPLLQLHLSQEFASAGFQSDVDRAVNLIAPQQEEVNDFLLQGMESVGLLPPAMQEAALLLVSAD